MEDEKKREKKKAGTVVLVCVIGAVAVFLMLVLLFKVSTGMMKWKKGTRHLWNLYLFLLLASAGLFGYGAYFAATDDISAFNSKHGKNAVRFIRLGEKNGKCYVETAFKDVETYAKYSGYEVKLTKVKASKANFDAIFSEVKDGKKSGYIDAYKVKKMKGQLLVLNENITVKVPGDVKCVSDEGTKVNEDGSVTIKPVNGNNDYAVNTYIIFE